MRTLFQKLFILLLLTMLFSASIMAQSNWRVGGNNNVNNIRLGTNMNFDVIFETNAVDRGVLENDGDWGLGTLAPLAQLHVNSDANEDGSVYRLTDRLSCCSTTSAG